MEIKTRQTDDKPLTVIIEYPILDTKTKKLIKKIESLDLIKKYLDMAVGKRYIDYINAQLERKRENNDKI